MDKNVDLVTEWLLCASSQVGPDYFQLPVAGADADEAVYRERVYCYELYHRWRCHWTEGFPYSLCGEIDKNGHPLIRCEPKPDFLVHVPGRMDNLLIVEIKPGNAAIGPMVEDLKKLTRFRRDLKDQYGNEANYQAAFFWIYGLIFDEWQELKGKLLKQVGGSADFDWSLISCIIHEKAGLRAFPVAWE